MLQLQLEHDVCVSLRACRKAEVHARLHFSCCSMLLTQLSSWKGCGALPCAACEQSCPSDGHCSAVEMGPRKFHP